jgi:uncharacterized protein with ParB-like and HNH nuclease domain
MNFSSSAIEMSNIFNDQKSYVVPLFQRSYSWKKEQIEELYTDVILYSDSKDDAEYFVGTMVFSPHSDKSKITILDGQQRFASIFIFLSALRDVLKKSKIILKDDWIDEIERTLFRRPTPSIEKRSKLELNKEDKFYFEEIVLNGRTPKPERHSHTLMKGNYEFLVNMVTKGVEAIGESYVKNILDVIYNKLFLIRIDVSDEVNANLLFETLNDRGLDLSAADLIKNYLFLLAGNDFEFVSSNWDRMSDQIGDNNISRFLRHYWISSFDFVKKENLYRSIKQKISQKKIKEFSANITQESTIYSNLINPTAEFWEEQEIVNLLNEINILRVEQVYILLLAVSSKFFNKRDRIKRILKTLINFTFRYNTISGLDPKALENLYGTLAINFRLDKIDSNKMIEEIKLKSPSADIFKASFAEFQTRNRKLAKYILFKINHLQMHELNRKELKIDVDNVNLEHVVPKNPNAEWVKFLKEEGTKLDDILYKLGNQTILFKEYNKEVSNQSFDKKLTVYKKSELPINQDLIIRQKFGKPEIEERQSDFAKLANKIWNV